MVCYNICNVIIICNRNKTNTESYYILTTTLLYGIIGNGRLSSGIKEVVDVAPQLNN